MEQHYQPNYFEIDLLLISEIVFEKGTGNQDVTMLGFYKRHREKSDASFSCSFSQLITLLYEAGFNGRFILDEINNRLISIKDEYPTIINVDDLLPEPPLEILTNGLRFYRPKYLNKKGDWEENLSDSHFFIELGSAEKVTIVRFE